MDLEFFRVSNFRNILDSGWISTNRVTAFVGQNEAGKSNLFEALYTLNPFIDGASYNADEDWPVDQWKSRKDAEGKLVCKAQFRLGTSEVEALALAANKASTGDEEAPKPPLPSDVTIVAYRNYGYQTSFAVHGFPEGQLDAKLASAWAKATSQSLYTSMTMKCLVCRLSWIN